MGRYARRGDLRGGRGYQNWYSHSSTDNVDYPALIIVRCTRKDMFVANFILKSSTLREDFERCLDANGRPKCQRRAKIPSSLKGLEVSKRKISPSTYAGYRHRHRHQSSHKRCPSLAFWSPGAQGITPTPPPSPLLFPLAQPVRLAGTVCILAHAGKCAGITAPPTNPSSMSRGVRYDRQGVLIPNFVITPMAV